MRYERSMLVALLLPLCTLCAARRDHAGNAFIPEIRNLGFGVQGDSDAVAIRNFQSVHKKLERTGKLDDDTKQAVRDLDDKRLRDWFDDEPRAAS